MQVAVHRYEVARDVLAELASVDTFPIHTITTQGRIHYVFGAQDKYPQYKIVLAGPGGKETEMIYMMVKCNSSPSFELQVDQMLQLASCKVRPAWTLKANRVFSVNRESPGEFPAIEVRYT